jgi:hypothetical protein
MEPIRAGQLEVNIASAHVTFHDTGEVHALTNRPLSTNHFFEMFSVGEVEIQLRLDWSCLPYDGFPMLDADFIDPKTGKHLALRGERKEAHHTAPSPGKGRCYDWVFQGFRRRFTVTVAWLAFVSETVHAEESCSCEVIRAAFQKPINQ